MSIFINYKSSTSKKNSSNLVFFVDDKFNISPIKKYILGTEFSLISDLITSKDPKKKIIDFDVSSKKKIILVCLSTNLTSSDVENLGAKFYDLYKDIKQSEYIINSDTVIGKFKGVVGFFLHGLKLKSYLFEKYKSKKNK